MAEADELEAKRLRKAEKKAAAAAAAEEDEEINRLADKAGRKQAARLNSTAVVAAEMEEADEAEAKRIRKAQKKAAAAAAAAAEEEEEVDEEEAKRQRKAVKKAAKEAAAAAEEEAAEEEEKRKTKTAKEAKKRAAAEVEEDEEAPSKKKSKTADETAGAAPGPWDKHNSGELKLFIKGLPYSVEESAFRADFEACGPIEVLQLPMEDGRPKGFAFITYATQAGFDAALKFDNTEYGGRWITVEQANAGGKGKGAKGEDGKGKGKGKPGDWTCPNCGDLVFARNNACRGCNTERPGGPVAQEHDHENTVFIRGLPWAATEDQLRKDFADCGEIDTLRMPMNAEGRPSGIAFMKFKTAAAVDAALKFDDTDYGGRTLNVCKSGETSGGKGKGKGGKDSKGKDGKGKDGKGKGKDKGKSKAPSASFAKSQGVMVAGMGTAKTFDDSDDE